MQESTQRCGHFLHQSIPILNVANRFAWNAVPMKMLVAVAHVEYAFVPYLLFYAVYLLSLSRSAPR
ncbi:Protein purity of essence [Lucilia cuprina]|nr:Protein purity of essence [Lucilia cuprina]